MILRASIAAALAVTACGEPELQTAHVEDVCPRETWDAAERIRNLSLSAGRAFPARPVADLARQFQDDPYPGQNPDYTTEEQAYALLGFYDLGARDADEIEAAGSYNGTITISDELDQERVNQVCVHEITHLLQDLHFDVYGYVYPYERLTSDRELARLAVVEGGAELARSAWMVERAARESGTTRSLADVDWDGLFAAMDEGLDDLLRDYEPYREAGASFAYRYGLAYAAHNLGYWAPAGRPERPRDESWEEQNELYLESDRIPASTRQILDLDVDGSLEPAEEVGLRAVPADLGTTYETVTWDTLGEWYFYLLLHRQDGARTLAGSWDGDTVLFARRSDTRELGFVWTTAWDSELAAKDALRALCRHYGCFAGFGSEAAVGEDLLVRRQGRLVVVVKSLDSSRHLAEAGILADRAFAATELE